MRRVIASLLVCLIVCLSSCSPVCAFAQGFQSAAGEISTAAAIQFDVSAQKIASVTNDYEIMPLAVSDISSINIGMCSYDSLSDHASIFKSGNIHRDWTGSEANFNQTVSSGYSGYSSVNPYLGFRVLVNNVGYSLPGALNLTLHNFQCNFLTDEGWFTISPDLMAPVVCFVQYDWTGTGVKRNDPDVAPDAWISLKGTNRTGSCSSSADNLLFPSGLTPSYMNRPVADLHLQADLDLPKTATVGGIEYEVVSGSVTNISFWFVFSPTPSSIRNGSDPYDFTYAGNWVNIDLSRNTEFRFVNIGNQPAFKISYNANGSSDSSVGFTGIQQSVAGLSATVTKKIAEVKQTIQQGANEVKNELSNQTQTLTDKLIDVKDGIVEGITDLKDTTTQGFKDVVQVITDLPGKIGEMLQGLIVPDSDKVSGKFSDFNDLAEEKLGVIYQVPEMMFSMANSIVSGAVEQKGEMTLPKFEIIMPATNQSRAGERLTVWEEYTFQIWPEGTEVIHTAVQTATSMVCVILMFNALKRKYEDWLDGK